MYHDVTLTTQEYIREVTVIQASWLTEVASHYFELKKPDAPKAAPVSASALDALRTDPSRDASKLKKKRKPEFGTETRDDDDDDDGAEELVLPTKIVFKGKQQSSGSVFATVPRKRRAGMGL